MIIIIMKHNRTTKLQAAWKTMIIIFIDIRINSSKLIFIMYLFKFNWLDKKPCIYYCLPVNVNLYTYDIASLT